MIRDKVGSDRVTSSVSSTQIVEVGTGIKRGFQADDNMRMNMKMMPDETTEELAIYQSSCGVMQYWDTTFVRLTGYRMLQLINRRVCRYEIWG